MYPERVPNLPPLASLRAFDAAARHLSFRVAADELSVTPSAISHQVGELEQRLGVALFHRRSRRVELTEAGALYQPYVRDAFESIRQGTSLVTRSGSTLDVQVYVTVAVRWLIPRLHGFTSANPDTRVRLNTSTLDWEFDDTAGDVAIVCTDQPVRPGLKASHLFDARLTAVCSPQWADAAVFDAPLLPLYTAPDETEAWCRAAGLGIDALRRSTRFDSYLLAIEAAIEGQGLAVVPTFLVGTDLRTGRLVAPVPVEIDQPRRWYLVCRNDHQMSPAVVRFREWLHDEVLRDPFIGHAPDGPQ
jgi:LysR family glycine cleavage system transcriptional activator